MGMDYQHDLSFGDRMVLVNQKQGFLQMAIEYAQARSNASFVDAETQTMLVPSHIVHRCEWAAIENGAAQTGQPNTTPLAAALKVRMEKLVQKRERILGATEKYGAAALETIRTTPRSSAAVMAAIGGADDTRVRIIAEKVDRVVSLAGRHNQHVRGRLEKDADKNPL